MNNKNIITNESHSFSMDNIMLKNFDNNTAINVTPSLSADNNINISLVIFQYGRN